MEETGDFEVYAAGRNPGVDTRTIRLSELVSALSYALDLTEGQAEGHSVRSCFIGMRIADAAGISGADRSRLFYALLLKDLGCSSNASRTTQLFGASDHDVKRTWKLTDWSRPREAALHTLQQVIPGSSLLRRMMHTAGIGMQGAVGTELVRLRCDRGADIAQQLGFDTATSEAIRALDEHWDGAGKPFGLAGEQIPLLARIINLAQTTEIFAAEHGHAAAISMARARAGTWFEPRLVSVFVKACADSTFWQTLHTPGILDRLPGIEPKDRIEFTDEAHVDVVAAGFARVIDAKSPFTYRHSTEVARIAANIATELDMDDVEIGHIHRAGLLHDIGKLGVSNTILDKPSRLTAEEMTAVQLHPLYTARILRRVGCFRPITDLAAAHHERLDGKGYHSGLGAGQLSLSARALAVADVFEALSAERPYREALPVEKVFGIMREQVGTGLCGISFAALERSLGSAAVCTPLPVDTSSTTRAA